MKYLIEYKNKWGDMIRQASTAADDASAFAEAEAVCNPQPPLTPNEFIGVYRQIERPAPELALEPSPASELPQLDDGGSAGTFEDGSGFPSDTPAPDHPDA